MKNRDMIRFKYVAALGLCAATLSGCGIYSNYDRSKVMEEPSSEQLYSTATLQMDTNSTLASLSYKELFTDSHLQILLQEAINNNKDLLVARMQTENAQTMLSTARLAYLPTFNLSGQVADGVREEIQSTHSVGIQSSWEIDIFGKVRNAKEQSKALLEQSKAYEQAVQTQLISSVASSYYMLLSLDAQLAISDETLMNWAESIRAMEALKQFGMYNEAAVAQAKSNMLALEASRESLWSQIGQLENSINAVLARGPQTIERSTLLEQNFPTDISVGVPLELLANRPDVQVAEYSLAQKFYATNAARSAFYPSITLSGSAMWTNNYGAIISNPGEWLVTGVASALMPIFNSGQIRAQYKVSKSEQEQALLTYKQTILDAAKEVNNALLAWQSASQRLEFDDQRIQELEKALVSTELLMKYRSTNYLEVLTAQNNLLNARLTQASDKYSQIEGVITLYHALGGGTK